MSCKDLRFTELPAELQKSLSGDLPDSLYDESEMMLVIDSDRERFRHETVFTGPWVNYSKIIDSKKECCL